MTKKQSLLNSGLFLKVESGNDSSIQTLAGKLPERFCGDGSQVVSLAMSSSLEVIDPIPEDVPEDEDEDIITAPELVRGLEVSLLVSLCSASLGVSSCLFFGLLLGSSAEDAGGL